jgi:hypothetical protein
MCQTRCLDNLRINAMPFGLGRLHTNAMLRQTATNLSNLVSVLLTGMENI